MSVRDEVLNILESEKGKNVSGQKMAGHLGVSRTAVWKVIDRLKNEGYDIYTGADGYMLSAESDRLVKRKIENLIDGKNINLYIYDSLDSTNNECKRLIADGKRDIAVIAEEQTAGRGRYGRSFYSPPEKGLYLSIALRRDFPVSSALMITTYTAVAVVEEIKKLTDKDCKIKWVNDIFYEDLKICGILTEAVTDIESGNITDIIVGIGINLHQMKLPEELQGIAGCIDSQPIKNELSAGLINRIFDFDPNDNSHMDNYRDYSMIIGKKVGYIRNGIESTGIAKMIDADGRLIIEKGQETETLESGEVSIRL